MSPLITFTILFLIILLLTMIAVAGLLLIGIVDGAIYAKKKVKEWFTNRNNKR